MKKDLGIWATEKPFEQKSTVDRCSWANYQKHSKFLPVTYRKYFLTKDGVTSETKMKLLTVRINWSLVLCKYFIACLAAAVYNEPLLRLHLSDAIQVSHKVELLKLEQKPVISLRLTLLQVGASNLAKARSPRILLKMNTWKVKARNFTKVESLQLY